MLSFTGLTHQPTSAYRRHLDRNRRCSHSFSCTSCQLKCDGECTSITASTFISSPAPTLTTHSYFPVLSPFVPSHRTFTLLDRPFILLFSALISVLGFASDSPFGSFNTTLIDCNNVPIATPCTSGGSGTTSRRMTSLTAKEWVFCNAVVTWYVEQVVGRRTLSWSW